jgi:hypothetical protein
MLLAGRLRRRSASDCCDELSFVVAIGSLAVWPLAFTSVIVVIIIVAVSALAVQRTIIVVVISLSFAAIAIGPWTARHFSAAKAGTTKTRATWPRRTKPRSKARSTKTLATKTLATKTLATKTLATKTLATKTLAAKTLAAKTRTTKSAAKRRPARLVPLAASTRFFTPPLPAFFLHRRSLAAASAKVGWSHRPLARLAERGLPRSAAALLPERPLQHADPLLELANAVFQIPAASVRSRTVAPSFRARAVTIPRTRLAPTLPFARRSVGPAILLAARRTIKLSK